MAKAESTKILRRSFGVHTLGIRRLLSRQNNASAISKNSTTLHVSHDIQSNGLANATFPSWARSKPQDRNAPNKAAIAHKTSNRLQPSLCIH